MIQSFVVMAGSFEPSCASSAGIGNSVSGLGLSNGVVRCSLRTQHARLYHKALQDNNQHTHTHTHTHTETHTETRTQTDGRTDGRTDRQRDTLNHTLARWRSLFLPWLRPRLCRLVVENSPLSRESRGGSQSRSLRKEQSAFWQVARLGLSGLRIVPRRSDGSGADGGFLCGCLCGLRAAVSQLPEQSCSLEVMGCPLGSGATP